MDVPRNAGAKQNECKESFWKEQKKRNVKEKMNLFTDLQQTIRHKRNLTRRENIL